MLYNSIWLPSVGYVLGQTMFTRSQLNTIDKKSMPTIYAKCGFNRNTSKAILQGPANIGGGGFVSIRVKQCSDLLQQFIKLWRSPQSRFSKLLRAILSWSQFHSGLDHSILMDTKTNLSYLDGRLIPVIRSHLNDLDATLEIDHPYVPQKL